MASLKELTASVKPVLAYPKSIQFGHVTVDGYMLEDGSFRQSLRSTGQALGMLSNSEIQRKTLEAIRGFTSAGLLSSAASGSEGLDPQKSATPTGDGTPAILPVRCSGVTSHSSLAYTINLPMVAEVWKLVALGGGKYAPAAIELMGLSMVHSLERAYQEAFGVSDTRTTSDRLLDWAIRLDPGKHYPLFGGQFHSHFARVTGVSIGHRYAQVCLAELVYHRLPKSIYETLKDINPVDPEKGWRQHSHSQLMSDDMRQQMREIVAAVTNQMANTPSKAEDPLAYRNLLQRLDKTLPRYRTRRHTALKAA